MKMITFLHWNGKSIKFQFSAFLDIAMTASPYKLKLISIIELFHTVVVICGCQSGSRRPILQLALLSTTEPPE